MTLSLVSFRAAQTPTQPPVQPQKPEQPESIATAPEQAKAPEKAATASPAQPSTQMPVQAQGEANAVSIDVNSPQVVGGKFSAVG